MRARSMCVQPFSPHTAMDTSASWAEREPLNSIVVAVDGCKIISNTSLIDNSYGIKAEKRNTKPNKNERAVNVMGRI